MLRNLSRRKRHLAGDVWPVCVRVLCEGITQRTLANGRPEKEDEG